MEVNIIIVAIGFLVVAAEPSMVVELNSEWKPNFGWEVVCSWSLYPNDTLQSVRLYKSDQLFLIFRPERDGTKQSTLARLTNVEFRVDCFQTQRGGVTGKCVISVEILQPDVDNLSFTCEASGERPKFRVESKTIDIEALVPPSDAKVENIIEGDESSGRVTENCTSTGLPAPNLVWTIGDQKIPQDFSGGAWNFTTKLFHVWSSRSYSPADSTFLAICTPETRKGGKLVKGQSAKYVNGASILRGAIAMITPCVLIIATLIR